MSTSTSTIPQSRRPSRRCREPAVCINVATLSPLAPGQFHREHLSSAFERSKPNMYRDSSFSSSDMDSSWPLTPPLGEESQHNDEVEDQDEDYGIGCCWSDYGLSKSLHRTSSNDSFQCRGLGMFNIQLEDNKTSTLEAAATASTTTKSTTSTLLAPSAFAEAADRLSSPICFSNLKLDSAPTTNTKRRRSTLSRLRSFSDATDNDVEDDKTNTVPIYEDFVQPGSAARRMSDFTSEADQRVSPSKRRPSTPVRPPRPETLVWNSAFAVTFPTNRRSSAQPGISEDIDEEGDEPHQVRDGCSPMSSITGAPRLSWLSNNRSRHTFPLDLTFAVNTFLPRGQANGDTSRLPPTMAVNRNDSICSIKQRLSSALKNAGLPTPAEELIVSLRSSEVAPQVSPRIRMNSIVDYDAATPPAQTGFAARKGSAPLPSPSYTTLLWAAAARRRASATPAMTFCSSSSPRRSKRSSLTPTYIAAAAAAGAGAGAGSRKDSLSIGNDARALTARWRELDDDEATLDQVGVTPSDQLVVALRRAHYVHF